MERAQNQGREGAETATVGLYCLQKEKDKMFGRKANLQALSAFEDTLCISNNNEKTSAENRLYVHAR